MRRLSILISLVLLMSSAASAQLRLPIPSLPGVNVNPSGLAIQAASKQITPYIIQQDPVQLDWAATYTPMSAPPGRAFHPASGARAQAVLSGIVGQLAHSPSGYVRLMPGDYSIPVRVYCSRVHAHMPVKIPEVYVFGPLRGTRKDVLTAMYSRISTIGVPYHEVQPLSWSIQTGMRYSELPERQRSLFDRLIPQMRSQISGNFIDQVRDHWNTLHILGLPPFDDVLSKIGPAGELVSSMKLAQNQILQNADNFDALSAQLAPPLDVSERGENYQTSPWAQVSPNVYMHTPSVGGTGNLFDLQVRVTGTQAADVPLIPNIMYPVYCTGCQPLTYNVETTPKQTSNDDAVEGMP